MNVGDALCICPAQCGILLANLLAVQALWTLLMLQDHTFAADAYAHSSVYVWMALWTDQTYCLQGVHLSLDASGDVHHQEHHVDDLCAANDCSDEGGMARAVYKGHL